MVALIGYGLVGIVVAVGVVAVLVLVLPGDHLGVAPRDVVPSGLPARPEIGGDDVARVRLPVTLRGYRMVDTDAVLDRLAVELERRDHEIDDLRRAAGLPARPTEVASEPSPTEVASEPSRSEPSRSERGGAERGGLGAQDEVLAAAAVPTGPDDAAPHALPGDPRPHPTAGDPLGDDAADAVKSPR